MSQFYIFSAKCECVNILKKLTCRRQDEEQGAYLVHPLNTVISHDGKTNKASMWDHYRANNPGIYPPCVAMRTRVQFMMSLRR